MYDFFGLLQEGIVESRNLETIFDNLAIINFNYDRCVEHFHIALCTNSIRQKGKPIFQN
jgi:hypothetical protein